MEASLFGTPRLKEEFTSMLSMFFHPKEKTTSTQHFLDPNIVAKDSPESLILHGWNSHPYAMSGQNNTLLKGLIGSPTRNKGLEEALSFPTGPDIPLLVQEILKWANIVAGETHLE